MFHLVDDPDAPELRVDAIHDEPGFRRIRRVLARQHDVAWSDPDIQVTDVDLTGDRRLIVQHNVVNGALLQEQEALRVLQHLADLWPRCAAQGGRCLDGHGAQGALRPSETRLLLTPASGGPRGDAFLDRDARRHSGAELCGRWSPAGEDVRRPDTIDIAAAQNDAGGAARQPAALAR